jgi:hypothetical protein
MTSALAWRLRVTAERCRTATQAARAGLRHRALWRLTGPASSDGSPLTLVTDLTGDADAYWRALLFAATPSREPLGRHRVLRRLALGRGADVTLVSHHRAFRRHARRLGYLTVPAWLDTGLPIGGTLDDTLAAMPWGRSSRESDLRRIRRAGLVAALVRDPDAIRTFLQDWYAPYVHARWGDTCVGLPSTWMRRVPRYGELLWVVRAGERLAGLLLESRGRTLRMLVLGMRDARHRRDGALAALYHFALAEAARRRDRLLRTGGARPVLSDGVLEFKRKWGAGLRHGGQHDYLALGIGTWSPAVRALFGRHPVVVEAARDRFEALTDPDVARHPPNAATRGMFEVAGLDGVVCPGAHGGWTSVALPSRGGIADRRDP